MERAEDDVAQEILIIEVGGLTMEGTSIGELLCNGQYSRIRKS